VSSLQPIFSTDNSVCSAVQLELLLGVCNNAMGIHRKSRRVQEAGVGKLSEFLSSDVEFVFTAENARAAASLLRCLQTFGHLAGEDYMVHQIIETMFLMRNRGFLQEFRRLGAIEILIDFLGKCQGDHSLEKTCFYILRRFPVEDIHLMLRCGIEQIIFTRMQESPDDCSVNSDSLSFLHWLYVHDSHAFLSTQDSRPVCIIFETTAKFMHKDGFFDNAVSLFSLLMRDMTLSKVHSLFVLVGYVEMISGRMKSIVESASVTPRDECLYHDFMEILCSISQCDHLYKSVAWPDIKVLLEAGMPVFKHNPRVLQLTFDIFRHEFFSPSKIDFTLSALSIAEMVLGVLTDNLDKVGLMVTCMLTLDGLSICPQVVNLLSQQDGFKTITSSLHNIVAVSTTPVLSHSAKDQFFRASLFILSLLIPCDNPTDQSMASARLLLMEDVMEIMHKHQGEILLQSLALSVLDKYMLPYPDLYCHFRLGAGLERIQKAMELPDLSSDAREISHKILRVFSTSPVNT